MNAKRCKDANSYRPLPRMERVGVRLTNYKRTIQKKLTKIMIIYCSKIRVIIIFIYLFFKQDNRYAEQKNGRFITLL